MNEFNDIKKQWEEREIPVPPYRGYNEILKKSRYLKKKQTISQIILSLTVLILVIYYFYISAYNDNKVITGLGIMAGSLLVRITLEYFSMMKKQKFPPDLEMRHYSGLLIGYYKKRKFIHYAFTPILFSTYILGFIMLLPAFEQHLSYGFYIYIIISSIIVFFALAVLIVVQISRELKILKDLVVE